jgi:hypothetical protein
VKATLEFDLPEEREEFELASNGIRWMCVLNDVDETLRSCIKHGHEFKSVDDALERIRCVINERMSDEGLTFR